MLCHGGGRWSPYVFLLPEGLRWDERNLRRGVVSLFRKGGDSVCELSRSAAYVYLVAYRARTPPKYIQEQAGHSSIQVTMVTYGHLFQIGIEAGRVSYMMRQKRLI
jgi:integrase